MGRRTIILFLLCGTTWAQSFTLQPGVVYPAGGRSIAAAQGDFNRDGHPNLLAVCLFQTTVYVVPGSGGCKFGTPISTSRPNDTFFGLAEGNFQDVPVADFNHDGDGTVLPPTMPVADSTVVATAILTADFDRDGNADLAIVAGT